MATLLNGTESSEREKPVSINMRADARKRNLIDMAAAICGRDRTSFILEAACDRAEQILLDQRMFLLDEAAFDAFEQALETHSLRDNKCLQQLLQRPKRWS